ncbi:MAG: S-layer homology domain-containing protein, partial [Oscillospiraceae bacterium]
MKKFVSMVLTLAMVVLLAAPAYTSPAMAATPRAQELAEMLYAADLFRGYGKDAAGQPIFGLDDTATRAESLVMLVRMLGKEAEARNTSYTTPFTDIPDWCKGEIGYGYTSGLTSGTSETTFSPTKTVTNTEFLVFALRALGYESGADYEWAKAAV